MRKTDIDEIVCSIARSVKEIGDTWKILIVKELFLHNRRFDELLRQTGMSSNSLAARLVELEKDGIIERRPYEDHPPRHEYFLSEKGIGLWPLMVALKQWGDRWHSEEKPPPLRITHKGCKSANEPRLVCGDCGEAMDARQAAAIMSPKAQRYRQNR